MSTTEHRKSGRITSRCSQSWVDRVWMANGVVGFCLERRKGISIRKARYRASEYRCRNHDTDVPRYLGESRGV